MLKLMLFFPGDQRLDVRRAAAIVSLDIVSTVIQHRPILQELRRHNYMECYFQRQSCCISDSDSESDVSPFAAPIRVWKVQASDML